MKHKIIISEHDDILTIEIRPAQKTIVKLGLFTFGVVLIVSGFFFAKSLISIILHIGFLYTDLKFVRYFIFTFAICALFFCIGINRFKRLFSYEIVMLSKNEITITNKVLGIRSSKTFPISKVYSLGFLGQHNFTKNATGNDSIDYLGIGATENEIQYMLRDGTLGFVYQNQTIRFGTDLPSWDAELIINNVTTFIKNTFKDDECNRIIGNLRVPKED